MNRKSALPREGLILTMADAGLLSFGSFLEESSWTAGTGFFLNLSYTLVANR